MNAVKLVYNQKKHKKVSTTKNIADIALEWQ